jgi:hypothetical protein
MPLKSIPLVRKFQILGGVLFLLAFLLPAVRTDIPDMSPQRVLRGYECVVWSARLLYEAMREWLRRDGIHSWTLGLIFGTIGLINPLLVWYLLAGAKWRRRIAILICVLIIETWIALALSQLTALIGHFVWVAGVLLLLAPEVSAWEDGSVGEPGTA